MIKYYYRESFDMCRPDCSKEIEIYPNKSLVKLNIGEYKNNKNYDITVYYILLENKIINNLIYTDEYISYEMKTLRMLKDESINIDDLEKLVKKYLNINLVHNDIARRNLGYDENGNLEFIDYDSFTINNNDFRELFTYLLDETNPGFNYKLNELIKKLKIEYH